MSDYIIDITLTISYSVARRFALNQNKINHLFVVLSTILVVVLLYIADQVLTLNYNTKIIVKLVLFFGLHFISLKVIKYNYVKDSLANIAHLNKNKPALLLGLIIFLFVLGAYMVLRQFIDVTAMVAEFDSKYEINRGNILYYGLYITFINSLLEEMFFRGFIFLNLKHLGFKREGYIFSSLIFSLYHLANFQNFVSPIAILAACVCLFVGGVIFCRLDDKKSSFFNSWFVHIAADAAIVLVGLKLFSVI